MEYYVFVYQDIALILKIDLQLVGKVYSALLVPTKAYLSGGIRVIQKFSDHMDEEIKIKGSFDQERFVVTYLLSLFQE